MGRKKTSKEIIGKRLKEILDSENYSISKLAIKIGYTREAISKSINNNKMDTTMLDIICKFFNVSPRYIEGIEKDITTYNAYNVYSFTDTLVQSSSNKYDFMNNLKFFMPIIPPTTTHQNKGIRVVKMKPYVYEREETKQARDTLTSALYKYGIGKYNEELWKSEILDSLGGIDGVMGITQIEKDNSRKVINKNHPIFPKGTPLSLNVKWCFPIDKDKKSMHDVVDGTYRITKPDTDNLQKMLKDCMTELGFWYDDAQVCEEHIGKYWSTTPGIWISINKLNG